MAALGEQMEVELAEQRPERVGILGLLRPRRPVDAQAIGQRAPAIAPQQNPAPVDARKLGRAGRRRSRAIAGDRGRARQEDANRAVRRGLVRAEHGERIAVARRRRAPAMRGRIAARRSRVSRLGGRCRRSRDGVQAAQRNRQPGRPVGRLVARSRRPPSRAGTDRAAPRRRPAATQRRAPRRAPRGRRRGRRARAARAGSVRAAPTRRSLGARRGRGAARRGRGGGVVEASAACRRRRAAATALRRRSAERPRRLALEVDDVDVALHDQHLAEMEIAVDAGRAGAPPPDAASARDGRAQRPRGARAAHRPVPSRGVDPASRLRRAARAAPRRAARCAASRPALRASAAAASSGAKAGSSVGSRQRRVQLGRAAGRCVRGERRHRRANASRSLGRRARR